jgi:hypothetical protein
LKSIVKNIFVTIVALTLLISTTGFQVYKHICASHNISAVSLIETPSCEKDPQIVEEIDDCCKMVEEIPEQICCEPELFGKSDLINFTSAEITCCTTSIENNQLESSLFPPTEQKISLLENYFVIIPINIVELQNSKPQFVIDNIDLPPPIFGKELLHTLHQLKIDTPIC